MLGISGMLLKFHWSYSQIQLSYQQQIYTKSMETNKKHSLITDEEVAETAKKAIQAANRSAEKLRDQKRRLGHKFIIYQDNKVITVDP